MIIIMMILIIITVVPQTIGPRGPTVRGPVFHLEMCTVGPQDPICLEPLYHDLIFIIIIIIIETCMGLPPPSSHRWHWSRPWCSSLRGTTSQSSTAFEIGAHEGSPPVDPDGMLLLLLLLLLVKMIMMKMMIWPNKFGPPKASLERLRSVEEEMPEVESEMYIWKSEIRNIHLIIWD